jgi:16S rRNA (guanine527-N7)-methyltransferase
LACQYADLVADVGVEWGLVGPREVPRLWDRHVLNCVAVAPLIGPGAQVVDAGSGAGLPGIPLAIARPDLDVVLVDAAERRCRFLSEVVAVLGLEHVHVRQARVEQLAGLGVDVVTARALAPLPRLVGWCLPLLRPGGELLAIRGEHAEAELAQAAGELAEQGASAWELQRVFLPDTGDDASLPPTYVVRITAGPVRGVRRGEAQPPRPTGAARARRHRRRPGE